MSTTNSYCSVNELTEWVGLDDSLDHQVFERACNAASRAVDRYCGRYFYQDSSATAHQFEAGRDCDRLRVRDISTTTGLIVKTSTTDGSTFSTTWAATDYRLEPYGGIVDGLTGFPYTTIVGVNRSFPYGVRPQVEITAKWGWAATPDEVKQATLIKAARVARRRQTPEGFAGGEFGVIRVSRFEDPDIVDLLGPFRLAGAGAGLVIG